MKPTDTALGIGVMLPDELLQRKIKMHCSFEVQEYIHSLQSEHSRMKEALAQIATGVPPIGDAHLGCKDVEYRCDIASSVLSSLTL